MNKFLSKNIFLNNNIVAPKGKIFDNQKFNTEEEFKRPYILKPINEGSSVGINIIKKETDINVFLKDKYLDYLMEEYIPGIDLTVGLMNGKVIGMIEVKIDKEIYDYEYKYNNSSIKYIVPKNLDLELKREIYKYSEKSFKLLNCKGIARVDFRINLKSENKKVFLLEINTQPGLTENSLFPKIAKNSGLEFVDLIEWIVNDAGVRR